MSNHLITRAPTGKPPWPILLLAGAEKAGKSYAAAEASSSAAIARTLWISVGEDDPDEYGALPGARFEIVVHDGSYRGILNAARAAAAQPRIDGLPNLLVIDSATRLWDLLCDEAQVTANARAAAKASRNNRPAPADDVQITMDLWNTAKQRWQHIIDVLRDHDGPSLLTARLEQSTVVDARGEPTKEKVWKVKAEKSLRFDVGAIVEMPTRGETYLTGVRSLAYKPSSEDRDPYNDFTVHKLWTDLGITTKDATSPRQHTRNDPEADDANAIKARIAEWCAAEGIEKQDAVDRFHAQCGGKHIKDETDPVVLSGFLSAWQSEHATSTTTVGEAA